MEPRELIHRIEEEAQLPLGSSERFAGYAVIGLPFHCRHVLALRRFPTSSLGSGYTSILHRDPRGKWTFYSPVASEQSRSRYFGSEIEENVRAQSASSGAAPSVPGSRITGSDRPLPDRRASRGST